MLIGTQEMQGAYELARRLKESLKDIPRKGNSFVYRVEGIIIEHIINLVDNRLEQMEIENQKNMTKELV